MSRFAVLENSSYLGKTKKIWYKVVDLDAGLSDTGWPKRVVANCAEEHVAEKIASLFNADPTPSLIPDYGALMAQSTMLSYDLEKARQDREKLSSALDDAITERNQAREKAEMYAGVISSQRNEITDLAAQRDCLQALQDAHLAAESKHPGASYWAGMFIEAETKCNVLTARLDTVSVHVNRLAEVLKRPR